MPFFNGSEEGALDECENRKKKLASLEAVCSAQLDGATREELKQVVREVLEETRK